ncbi:MAG: hypothetical protein KDA44_16380 [Planctomycetales bacterium]|nr:hypothetical protein [Planctomycetales bacterium]
MGSAGTRDSRRRRVLNDESRLGLSVVGRTDERSPDARKPRYGETAHIENHPQVSDLVPRRKRFVFAATLAVIGLAAGAETLLRIAADAPTGIPGVAAADLHALARGVMGWATVAAGLTGFALCRLIFSLRRHRVDDRRGNYRVWSWAALGCLAWPLCAITGLHRVVAQAAVASTGVKLLAAGAEWWLAPGLLVSAWIAYRLRAEMKEAPGSLTVLVIALACYAIAAVGASGWLPSAWGEWSTAAVRSLPLVGHALAVASLAGFARYVVLDVQGLIDHAPHRERSSRKRKTAKSEREEESPAEEPAKIAISKPRESRRQDTDKAPSPAAETPQLDWVGDEDEADDSDDSQPRKLSKAERKRLRNQQRQNRRAA